MRKLATILMTCKTQSSTFTMLCHKVQRAASAHGCILEAKNTKSCRDSSSCAGTQHYGREVKIRVCPYRLPRFMKSGRSMLRPTSSSTWPSNLSWISNRATSMDTTLVMKRAATMEPGSSAPSGGSHARMKSARCAASLKMATLAAQNIIRKSDSHWHHMRPRGVVLHLIRSRLHETSATSYIERQATQSLLPASCWARRTLSHPSSQGHCLPGRTAVWLTRGAVLTSS